MAHQQSEGNGHFHALQLMAKPRASVLIDTYNHERFIEKAIVSVLEQDLPNEKVEILVVDDGSTDKTPEIVRKFEPRVRLIRKANGGQASAFNLGIPQTQGEIVAFLDGDDWWAPSKLREVTAIFEKNPGLGAVGHGFHEVDYAAATNELVLPDRTYRLTLNDAAGARWFRLLEVLLGTSKLAVRKEVLDRILPIPEELVFVADTFIYSLAIAIAGGMVLDLPLCYYRVHSQNLFRTQGSPKAARRFEMLDYCMNSVSPRLSAMGISREVIAAFLEPHMLDMERVHLASDGGKRWRTFQLELAAHRLSYAETSLGYKVFKGLALGVTLFMPPRRYYQFKRWYTRRGFRRFREKLGNAVPAGSIHLRRQRVPMDL
jgi:glycosyltransferase involved in cell wall biosynthesis